MYYRQAPLGIVADSPVHQFTHLASGPIRWFSDWPAGDVPRSGAVVYTIWNREGSFIYVGMSGRSFTGGSDGTGGLVLGGGSIATQPEGGAVISSVSMSLTDLSFRPSTSGLPR